MTGPPPLVLHNDCLPVLRGCRADSLSAIITDPPYALRELPTALVVKALTAWLAGDREYIPEGKGFMGREWDSFVPPPAVWDECFRTLKPGAHMAIFAGSRTADLMGLSIRLAGFEIRDNVTWLYSSGFPKAKTVLKPASEPIIMARKPFKASIGASGIAANGTGGLNIDACRVPAPDAPIEAIISPNAQSRYTGILNGGAISPPEPRTTSATSAGRWPANVALSHASTPDGYDACAEGCVEGCPVAVLDAQSEGTRSSKPSASGTSMAGASMFGIGAVRSPGAAYSDSGGASRFYNVFRYQAKAPKSERPVVDGKAHPTVKPLALMRWLVKLITPPGGMVLDPFAGSGTTGEAAQLEGFQSILIERDPESIAYIRQRLNRERVSA